MKVNKVVKLHNDKKKKKHQSIIKVLQMIHILHFKSFEVRLNKDQFQLQFLITHFLLDGFKRLGIHESYELVYGTFMVPFRHFTAPLSICFHNEGE